MSDLDEIRSELCIWQLLSSTKDKFVSDLSILATPTTWIINYYEPIITSIA